MYESSKSQSEYGSPYKRRTGYWGNKMYVLSTQEFADGTKEEGYRYLTEFSFGVLPLWRYLTSGIEIEKEIAMAQGNNQIAVNYHLKNRGQEEAVLCVTPFFQFES